jgi:hypothetical protein
MKWIEISHDNFLAGCCYLKKTAEGNMLPFGWYLEFGDSEYRVESNGKGERTYYKMKEKFTASHTFFKNPYGQVQHIAEKEAKHENNS